VCDLICSSAWLQLALILCYLGYVVWCSQILLAAAPFIRLHFYFDGSYSYLTLCCSVL